MTLLKAIHYRNKPPDTRKWVLGDDHWVDSPQIALGHWGVPVNGVPIMAPNCGQKGKQIKHSLW